MAGTIVMVYPSTFTASEVSKLTSVSVFRSLYSNSDGETSIERNHSVRKFNIFASIQFAGKKNCITFAVY